MNESGDSDVGTDFGNETGCSEDGQSNGLKRASRPVKLT